MQSCFVGQANTKPAAFESLSSLARQHQLLLAPLIRVPAKNSMPSSELGQRQVAISACPCLVLGADVLHAAF